MEIHDLNVTDNSSSVKIQSVNTTGGMAVGMNTTGLTRLDCFSSDDNGSCNNLDNLVVASNPSKGGRTNTINNGFVSPNNIHSNATDADADSMSMNCAFDASGFPGAESVTMMQVKTGESISPLLPMGHQHSPRYQHRAHNHNGHIENKNGEMARPSSEPMMSTKLLNDLAADKEAIPSNYGQSGHPCDQQLEREHIGNQNNHPFDGIGHGHDDNSHVAGGSSRSNSRRNSEPTFNLLLTDIFNESATMTVGDFLGTIGGNNMVNCADSERANILRSAHSLSPPPLQETVSDRPFGGRRKRSNSEPCESDTLLEMHHDWEPEKVAGIKRCGNNTSSPNGGSVGYTRGRSEPTFDLLFDEIFDGSVTVEDDSNHRRGNCRSRSTNVRTGSKSANISRFDHGWSSPPPQAPVLGRLQGRSIGRNHSSLVSDALFDSHDDWEPDDLHGGGEMICGDNKMSHFDTRTSISNFSLSSGRSGDMTNNRDHSEQPWHVLAEMLSDDESLAMGNSLNSSDDNDVNIGTDPELAHILSHVDGWSSPPLRGAQTLSAESIGRKRSNSVPLISDIVNDVHGFYPEEISVGEQGIGSSNKQLQGNCPPIAFPGTQRNESIDWVPNSCQVKLKRSRSVEPLEMFHRIDDGAGILPQKNHDGTHYGGYDQHIYESLSGDLERRIGLGGRYCREQPKRRREASLLAEDLFKDLAKLRGQEKQNGNPSSSALKPAVPPAPGKNRDLQHNDSMNLGAGNNEPVGESDDFTLFLSAVRETQTNLQTLQPLVMQAGDPAAMEDLAAAFKNAASSSQFVLSCEMSRACSALNDAWAKMKRLEGQFWQGRQCLQQQHFLNMDNNTFIRGGMGLSLKSKPSSDHQLRPAITPPSGTIPAVGGQKSATAPSLSPGRETKTSNKKDSPMSSLAQKVIKLEDLPPQNKNDLEITMMRLQVIMDKTQMSQKQLQKWDKDNGLPKSHSQTMVNSGRSRTQLQNGVILKKWNGDPLISQEYAERSLPKDQSHSSQKEPEVDREGLTNESLDKSARRDPRAQKPVYTHESPIWTCGNCVTTLDTILPERP